MKTRGPAPFLQALTTLAIVLAFLALSTAQAAEKLEDGRVKGYVPPPKELKKLGEGHWTPYDPSPPPEGARVHTVVPGDTLWDLSLTYYQDHYLWPVIWDANRWVTYAHWIYPGDPLVIPPHPTVVPPEPPVPPPEAPSPPAGVEPEPAVDTAAAAPAPPAGPVLRPVADLSELYCSGILVGEHQPSGMQIIGLEERARKIVATGDVVYLNAGLSAGIQPGDRFSIIRPGARVRHPDTEKPYGVMVDTLGRLQVIVAQQETATAEIVFACDAVEVGNDLVPFEEIPVPLYEPAPFDRYGGPAEPVGPTGFVLYARDGLTAVGEGHQVAVDLGEAHGVKPGDTVTFYRERSGNLPRILLAAGVILRSGTIASTVKLTQSVREVLIGDRVEMR